MSLGVLNNLNAVYAENNLNNTNNSLNTVLQQLSSGSKINSGADDAAGLSMVDGLQANSTALTQSVTNAKEGVGLLQVADGALSQVTSLLNRAVTLATEASNGTLNSSQDTAANQEYQSILSEISNIGSTTTYNDTAVFGTNTNIYTGDASTAGSSVDALDIRTLSATNIGDTGGVMAYSNGQNNVFINLSSSSKNAQATDTLSGGSSGATTIGVNYLVKGANGTETTATTSISVGTGTSFANTANGLINAINSSGLGLTASFTTQAQAGIAGGGTQTGIQITGGLLSAGVDPNSTSTSGVLNPGGITSENLAQGQTISVKVGSTTAAAITINSSTSTLTGLMNAINNAGSNVNGSSTFVTASIVTNGNGSQSLALADTANSGGALTVTTASNPLGPNALTLGSQSADPVTLSFNGSAYTTGAAGSYATGTLGIAGSNTSGDAITGSIVLSNAAVAGNNALTFVMGGSTSGSTIGVSGGTLGDLAAAIQTNLGVSATVTSSGISMTSNNTGTVLEQVPGAGNNTLTDAASMAVSNVEGWSTASAGTDATATLAMNGDNGFAANGSTVLTGNLVLNNTNLGNETAATTFSMGGSGSATNTVYVNSGGGSATVTQLLASIAGSGVGATGSVATGSIVLTSGTAGTSFTVNSGGLLYSPTLTQTPTANHAGALSTGALFSSGGASTLSDTVSGNVVLSNNGVTDTFTMGGTLGANTIVVGTVGQGTATMNGLINSINGAAGLGLTASLNVSNGTVSLTPAAAGANIGVAGTGLQDDYGTQFTTPASGSNSLGTQYLGGLLTLNDGGSINGLGGALTGTFTLHNNDAGGGGNITDTFVMGGGAETLAADGGTITVHGNSLNNLIAAINDETANAGSNLDITASEDSASGGLFLQTNSLTTTAVTVNTTTAGNNLTDNVTEALTAGSGGSANVAGQVVFNNGGTNLSTDPVLGTITLANSSGGTGTFAMDGSTGHNTLGDLSTLINNDTGLGLTASISAAGLKVIESGNDYTDSITVTGALTNSFGTNLTASTTGNAPAAAQNASATVNTTAGNTIGTTDTITGNLTVQNGATTVTFTMGTGSGDIGGITIGALAQAISDNVALGVTADVNSTTHALELQANASGTVLSATSNLHDTVAESMSAQSTGTLHGESTTTLALGSGAIHAADVVTGSVILTANTNTVTFNMGMTSAQAAESTATNININGNTLNLLESAINSSELNITASNVEGGSNMVLTSNAYNNSTIGVGTNSLNDSLSASGNTESSASLGTFASASDVVSGTISYNLGGSNAQSFAVTSGETVQGLVNQINNNSSYGVTAALNPTGGGNGFVSLTLTSNTYGAAGEIESTGNTHVTDTTPTATLSYSGTSAYNLGLSNSNVYDSSSGQTSISKASFVANTGGSNGIATMSYEDGAGASLGATDLNNQTDAQTALTSLNTAITDVAAQDGYIGAQINTLNAVSGVLTTQQENVESAQNAVQATDYASATSNMSKYEILSQTGIAALAQANSIQQEVTKLLQ